MREHDKELIMARNINNQSILRRAKNGAKASNARREAGNKEASRRFELAILKLEELLLALTTLAPKGDGQWYFMDAFKASITKCERLNGARQFKAAWAAEKELRSELTECLTMAPKFEAEREPVESPKVEAHGLSNRQRKQARKQMACKARNERVVKGGGEVVLRKEGKRTVSEVKTSLGEILAQALAA